MKKNELVEKVAEGASLTKADAERAINALVNAVSEALVEGDKKQSKSLQSRYQLLKQVLHLKMQ